MDAVKIKWVIPEHFILTFRCVQTFKVELYQLLIVCVAFPPPQQNKTVSYADKYLHCCNESTQFCNRHQTLDTSLTSSPNVKEHTHICNQRTEYKNIVQFKIKIEIKKITKNYQSSCFINHKSNYLR